MERLVIVSVIILIYIGIMVLYVSKAIKILAYCIMLNWDGVKEEIKNFNQVYP
jgi:hypothetical protein